MKAQTKKSTTPAVSDTSLGATIVMFVIYAVLFAVWLGYKLHL